MYHKRRYRVVDGRFEKRWDNVDEPGWFKTKAEALEAIKVEASPPKQPEKRGPGRPRKNPVG
jgi:hypothetical protein